MIEFEPILRAIYDLPISEIVRRSVWAYPILEMLHLIGLGLLFGPIIIFDLRILGIVRATETAPLASTLLPWVWIGFAINATSGLILFGSDALEFGSNPAFQLKMALILASGINAALFHLRTTSLYASNDVTPVSFRIQAALSIILWISVIIAGRLIAYVA